MFGYLQESEKKFFDTRAMCRACKDVNGNPVDPIEQQVTRRNHYVGQSVLNP